mgnify:CR=1 FL=1
MNTEIINQSTYIKNEEIIHILEQIFNYYGIVSNKSTFTLDDVLLMYRIIRSFKTNVKTEIILC